MNRLETIASRQRKFRVRDALFAAFVVLAAAIAVASVSTDSNPVPMVQR
jgi:hypothetical protein